MDISMVVANQLDPSDFARQLLDTGPTHLRFPRGPGGLHGRCDVPLEVPRELPCFFPQLEDVARCDT